MNTLASTVSRNKGFWLPGLKNLLLFLIVAGSVLSTVSLMATAPTPPLPLVQEKAWPISTIQAHFTTLQPELALFGRIESPRTSHLSSAISAQVLEIHVREGQHITQGQLLLSLDPTDETLRLQQLEAALKDAESKRATIISNHQADTRVLTHMQQLFELTSARAERLQQLIQRQLIATEQLENTLQDVARQGIELARQQALTDSYAQRLASAQASVDSALSAVAEQQLRLERTRIYSPFDGRVSQLHTAPGDRVSHGSPLLEVYDSATLQIRAALPTHQVNTLKQALAMGQPVRAYLPAVSMQVNLSELAAAVDTGRAGIDGLFQLPANNQLEPGRTLQLQLQLPAIDQVIALPPQSLYDNKQIFIVEEERLRAVPVTLVGQRSDSGQLEMIVQTSELNHGAHILASSLPQASNGLRVSMSTPGAPKTKADPDDNY
ncbi:MAG: efflux RND transporter periplasmic adaptor subunit [Parahaliea sp.]